MVARGGNGAISILAAAAPDSLRPVPAIYMKKIAVGAVAAAHVSLSDPVAETIQHVAEAYGRRPGDLTALVLDRDRHEDLIDELRRTGARIKLIADGDITAAMSSAIRGTNNHLLIGIGGAREAVIAAAALACLGGEIQVQFWPRSRSDVRLIEEYGFDDPAGRAVDARPRARRRHRGRHRHLQRRPAVRRPLLRGGRADALDRALLALQPRALRGLDAQLLARPAPAGPSVTPSLAELHAAAAARGVPRYRTLSRQELEAALAGGAGAAAEPEAAAAPEPRRSRSRSRRRRRSPRPTRRARAGS